jgi:hypothetical protein
MAPWVNVSFSLGQINMTNLGECLPDVKHQHHPQLSIQFNPFAVQIRLRCRTTTGNPNHQCVVCTLSIVKQIN